MTLARLAPAGAAAVLALAIAAPSALAGANANNYDCGGHIEAGPAQPGDDDTQVQYVFACGGPITGYQIQPQIGDTGFSTDVSVFDQQNNPVTTDSFTCNGDFPGWGVNCIGKYTGNQYAKIVGTFAIATPLCAEPRVDPLLTVTYATADSKGAITQYISGPYDLGRPRGCKPSASSGSSRLATPEPTTEKAKPKTTATKKKVKAKAKGKKKAAKRKA
ncbi:MAG TPA: hypothetical protein VFG42_10415 [Baekduia sp.]|uniref:hypothetical protein n=1 Tax=Baekduia sp. TaxID=2600305 RepID=UPI002D792508|nr:hypothetical protein [Baekduia sp.]HET6507195.1 hypothetical protein [Baekduia sp.]